MNKLVDMEDTQPPNQTLRTVSDLIASGLVAPDAAGTLDAVAARYAIAITPTMLARIDRSDHADPIARQFVPSAAELDTRPEENSDPIGDATHTPVKGIVHRYPDRVLLKPTHACPVYCRFCFRREMVGPGGEALDRDELTVALAYIRARPAIREVVLSGGDPMILSARRLAEIIAALDAIAHVDVIRVHTRVPLVDPARVTTELVAALATSKALFVVLHANHEREFTPAGRDACAQLVRQGIPLLSQSVLLRGINDDPATLEALMREFLRNRIKPYYLHHPDLAPGTAQFRVSIEEGQALLRALRGRVSGLAQPSYVLDIPGGFGKVPIGPVYLGDGVVHDPDGDAHQVIR